MHGIFADQHQATRLEKSDTRACPEEGRRPHLNSAPKLLDWHAAMNAFDEQISPNGIVHDIGNVLQILLSGF
jgi:hypothetical protein